MTGHAEYIVDNGGVKYLSLPRKDQENAVKDLTHLLRSLTKNVTGVFSIPNARVPIVKFVHIQTGLLEYSRQNLANAQHMNIMLRV